MDSQETSTRRAIGANDVPDGLTLLKRRHGPDATELEQLESPYLARERVFANDPTKSKHRRSIARFFLKTLGPGAAVHCLSLPSYHWSFELALSDLRQNATFVGIERNRSVMDEAVPYMPGRQRRRYKRHTSIGAIDGWATDTAKHLWMSMGDFIGLKAHEIANKSGERRADFNKKYRRFSCAWLDFQSCVCSEVETALRWLPSALDANIEEVPVAITTMAARETKDVTARMDVFGGRAAYIRTLLGLSGFREVSYLRVTNYTSPAGTPMSLMVARLRLAHRNAQNFAAAPGAGRGLRVGLGA